jgi:hypothetical protein
VLESPVGERAAIVFDYGRQGQLKRLQSESMGEAKACVEIETFLRLVHAERWERLVVSQRQAITITAKVIHGPLT